MKEPYGEGLANHTDPESCGGVREGMAEALTGTRAGRPLSRESLLLRSADAVSHGGRQHRGASLSRDALRTPRGLRTRARTETLHAEPGRSRVRPRRCGIEVRSVNP
jgi:hypothetical protein